MHLRAERKFADEAKARKAARAKKRVVTKKVTVHKYTKQFSEEDAAAPTATYRNFGEVRKFIRDMRET